MKQEKICLASDNFTAAHPRILEALLQANQGYTPAYGADPWTIEAEILIQEEFETKCKVLFVPTGTGANVLSLAICCRRHESILCTDIAHLNFQETGAAEALVGCKLLSIPHVQGKATPDEIQKKLRRERTFGKHSTSPRVLSLTQSTEVGTIYTLKELKELSRLCKEENLLLHVDGCRLYNALIPLKLSLSELMREVPIDILSLGGTKNGLVGAEAVVIFNEALHNGADHLQKQMLLLLSKMRYLSCQYIPFFKEKLWQTMAAHANQKAHEIGAILITIPQVALSYSIETNQIFFTAPADWLPQIQEKIFCHIWNKEKNKIRFITSWNTIDKDVERVREVFTHLRA